MLSPYLVTKVEYCALDEFSFDVVLLFSKSILHSLDNTIVGVNSMVAEFVLVYVLVIFLKS
jgi:hypothetical protein